MRSCVLCAVVERVEASLAVSRWVSELRAKLVRVLGKAKKRGSPQLLQLLQVRGWCGATMGRRTIMNTLLWRSPQSRRNRHQKMQAHIKTLNNRDAGFRSVCRSMFAVTVKAVQDLHNMLPESAGGGGGSSAINMAYVRGVRVLRLPSAHRSSD